MERDLCSHSSHRSCIWESPSKRFACISLMSCSNARTLSASLKRFCCSRCNSSRAFLNWRSACWCIVSRNSILCCCCATCCRRLCNSSPAAGPSPQTLSSPARVAAEATLCMPGACDSEATLEASAIAKCREGEEAAAGADGSALRASATGTTGTCWGAPVRPREAPPALSAEGAAGDRVPVLPPPGATVLEPTGLRRLLAWAACGTAWEPEPEFALEGRSGRGGRVRGGVACREGTGLIPASLLGLWQRAGLAARPRARCAEVRMSSSSCSKRRSLASSSLRLRSSFSW
mmetsp:Transcript_25183/g.80001  ORF Transcript_25183/g.80001 Transcript_25183/m.80001 type:complete len:290 (-) Transcript_25183:284-1153(-)